MTAALQHLGDYNRDPVFSSFQKISADSWSLYHQQTDGKPFGVPLYGLITRMMYIAETTSAALRLNASWALTLPAFSLSRDRFEQTVRLSWLLRKNEDDDWHSFLDSYEAKKNLLKNAFDQRGIDPITDLTGPLDNMSKEERARYDTWGRRPVDQLARERDKLDGVTNSKIDAEKIEVFYESIYRQGSSVSHFDAYSIKMLNLYRKDGHVILAPDPLFPAILALHNALFDIITTAEATATFGRLSDKERWEGLLADWHKTAKNAGALE